MLARITLPVFALLTVAAAVAAACGGDDETEGGSPTAVATSPTASGDIGGEATPDSRTCELLGLADVESVAGEVISVQEGFPEEFESCYAFAEDAEVVLEVCECLTSEEFDGEVEKAAREHGTVSEPVLMVGDRAAWVPAGENDPNTGILWVLSGDTTLTLWLDVPGYADAAEAQADTTALMKEILAGL
jgi:hypothetical protein